MAVAKRKKRQLAPSKKDHSLPTTTVDSTALSKFLQYIYLGGNLGECVLDKVGKDAVVTAIDHNNMLWVNAKTQLEVPQSPLGLADLSLLIKFLTLANKDISMTVTRNRLLLSTASLRLKYLLTDPELISVQSDTAHEVGKNAMGEMRVKLKLRPGLVDDFLRVQGVMRRVETVSIVATKKGRVTFTGGLDTEHQFEVAMGKWERHGKKEASFPLAITVHSKYLTPILSCLEFPENPEEDERPKLYFGETLALIESPAQRVTWVVFHVEE